MAAVHTSPPVEVVVTTSTGGVRGQAEQPESATT